MDYLPGNSLYDRPMSAIPLSIGTSLAFESVFMPQQAPYDPARQIPNKVSLTEYQSCWINLTTMIRNLASSVKTELFTQVSVAELVQVIMEEVDVLETLFKIEGKELCRPVFYHSTYAHLLRQHKLGLSFREPSSEKQKFYALRVDAILTQLHRQSDQFVKLTDTPTPKSRDRALIFTHQPYDLCDYERFERLDLLESNTGVLKPRARWNTKYAPMSNQDFSHLPFFRKLLYVFGDRYLIKPSASPLRQQILKTSIERNWTPMTTLSKIRLDLSLDVRDPYLLSVFESL